MADWTASDGDVRCGAGNEDGGAPEDEGLDASNRTAGTVSTPGVVDTLGVDTLGVVDDTLDVVDDAGAVISMTRSNFDRPLAVDALGATR